MHKCAWIVFPLLMAGCGTAPAPQQTFEPASQALASAGGGTADTGKVAAVSPFGSSAPAARPVTIPSGTALRVRLAQALSTARQRRGDRFKATLDAPISVEGKTIVPKGTTFTGHVTSAGSSGRLRGRALLALKLDSFDLDGKTHRVATSAVSRSSDSHRKRNIGLIGGGSGLGAAIGAIAGGGKGALIGAGAGAAAGTAGAAATGKRNVALPVESVLIFELDAPVTL